MNKLAKAYEFRDLSAKMLTDLKEVVPEKFFKIAEVANNTKFSDNAGENEIKKQQDLQKSYIEAYLEKQSNIDILTPALKAMAAEYKELSNDAKLEQSAKYWTIVDTGLALLSAERKNKIMSSGGTSGELSPIAQHQLDSLKKWQEKNLK
jgi:hypothetical protein